MAAKQKVVLLLDLQGNDVKEKRKVLKAVSTYPGLDLIAVDMKQRKLTVVGLVDPIELVTKLRKHWRAYIFYVGPANKEDVPTGGVKEDGDGPPAEATANQVERPVADVRSWPHAVAVPARYPYPHHQHVAGAHQEEQPHGYHYVGGGGLAATAWENHDKHPDTYVAYGVRENHPKSYYGGHGAHENSPNGCAIC